MYYPLEFSPIITWLIILPAVALIALGVVRFLQILNR